jgi:hypothetical protein
VPVKNKSTRKVDTILKKFLQKIEKSQLGKFWAKTEK